MFTQEDLRKMGLKEDPQRPGKYVKAKKEKKLPVTNGNEFLGQIFLSGNVPSLKNSKRIHFKNVQQHLKGKVKITMNGSPAVPFITSSALVEKYKEDNKRQYDSYRQKFIELTKSLPKPYLVEFVFIRTSNRSFDFNNANHLITDMMAKHGWVDDDDMVNVIPIPRMKPPFYFVNKANAGVWLTVKRYQP